MLFLAKQVILATKNELSGHACLHFAHLDFTTHWSSRFEGIGIDAITSSMAIHHADDKPRLFQQVFTTLKPKGVFVFADHMAGASACVQHLIASERALVRLGRDGRQSPEQVLELIRRDEVREKEEGDICETAAQYQQYLTESGFEDVDCLWRDYWLAVFVARKPI